MTVLAEDGKPLFAHLQLEKPTNVKRTIDVKLPPHREMTMEKNNHLFDVFTNFIIFI